MANRFCTTQQIRRKREMQKEEKVFEIMKQEKNYKIIFIYFKK